MGCVMTRRFMRNLSTGLTHLTASVRSTLSTRAGAPDGSRSRHLAAALCVALLLPWPAQAVESKDVYILYAHTKIVDYKQFRCFKLLISKENASWNPKAIGNLAGSRRVYGIGQMKSEHYKTLDAFAQIDASLKYIKNRYGTPCKSWSFFQKNGYH
jgi:hypothetical protein